MRAVILAVICVLALAPTPLQAAPSQPAAAPIASAIEIDLDALSGEQIDRLLGEDESPLVEAAPYV